MAACLDVVEVALEAGAKASYRVDTAGDIDPAWLDGVEKVGVTSGASVPDALVQGVLTQWGLGDAAQSLLPAGSMGGMQLFWIAAAVVIGLAAVGVVRLSQEA